MRALPLLLTVPALLFSLSASAQYDDGWLIEPLVESHSLSQDGWEITSAAGLSWPDGRQAVVEYWTRHIDGKPHTFRCISSFDKDMRNTGSACYSPSD